ncbi:uncharacterized protein MONOS_7398 [Monocercomonoides exilis]|uniref:uncharacterized protein n=1 Tax=Monocercomonoides exilis TaxID=2049356 RepID=UPI0035594116|nr:hypothetical protein MONOS_7398 [Monocercomonoides exilis]|eukprot:MONOS_7398.1-p1 / transcript=MONOS_7398.1 / gene=MONOS_7398 / organism=Monocercomonoides_exilis_PA203 / gene_product=unspecified product / transcript_product=unspecified product / location=Mono_scaffold00251:67162-67444(+) / protein_length=67 / sequence_SO=supercontig / SO=protein_coding / is_pseudo=false
MGTIVNDISLNSFGEMERIKIELKREIIEKSALVPCIRCIPLRVAPKSFHQMNEWNQQNNSSHQKP